LTNISKGILSAGRFMVEMLANKAEKSMEFPVLSFEKCYLLFF